MSLPIVPVRKFPHTQQCSTLGKVLEHPSTSGLGTHVPYRPVTSQIDQPLVLTTLKGILPSLGPGCSCKPAFRGDHLWRHSTGTWGYRPQRVCDSGCKDRSLRIQQDNLRSRCQPLDMLLRGHRASGRQPLHLDPFPPVERRMGKHEFGRPAGRLGRVWSTLWPRKKSIGEVCSQNVPARIQCGKHLDIHPRTCVHTSAASLVVTVRY